MVNRGLGSGYFMEIMPIGGTDALDVGVRQTEDLRMSPRNLASHWEYRKGRLG